MAIYLTGDTHGELRRLASSSWYEGKTLTKRDYLIILGDFGVLWSTDKHGSFDKYWLDWLDKKPWTTLFLDGNHENFALIDNLQTINKFGADVGRVNSSVYHLRRGRVYTIEGQTFFVMGGAASIDKKYRTVNESWWAREQPNDEEISLAWKNLGEHNFSVDYALTHTIPINLKKYFVLEGMSDFFDPLEYTLEQLLSKLDFIHHYFGHWHRNESLYLYNTETGVEEDISKHTCLYGNILKLGDFLR